MANLNPSSLEAQGQVITFYSYKGGTGRSMALANVACVLSQELQLLAGQSSQVKPKGVLLIDWDLEAPGLHRYFYKYFKKQFSSSETAQQEFDLHVGLIDFFIDLRRRIDDEYGEGSEISEDLVGPLLHSIRIDNYIIQTDIPYVYLLKAGKFDAEYMTRVSRFNWEASFLQIEQLFTIWAEQLSEKFNYVLIDSRTGATDTSNICSMLMPEKLVTVFTPNSQSLSGIINSIEEAIRYRAASDDLRPLIIFPLPSRIDLSEQRLRETWRYGDSSTNITGYQSEFEKLFRAIYKGKDYNLDKYFGEVQIQHVPRYSYGEDIAVLLERKDAGRLSLSSSYRKFALTLLKEGPWQEAPKEVPSAKRIEIVELEALSAKSSAQRKSYDFLGALVTSVQAAKKLQQIREVPNNVRSRVIDRLYRVVRTIRERNRFEGHGDDVWNVSFSPSGDSVVSASEDRTLKLWRLDGDLLTNFIGHDGKVRDVSFSPLGNLIASASEDRTVKLWAPNGDLIQTLKGHRDHVLAVCFSPDGQTIVSAGSDRSIKVWKTDGSLIKTIEGHEDIIWDLSYHPTRDCIASASEDGTVRLWTSDGKPVQVVSVGSQLYSVGFSPNGDTFAAAGVDKEVKVWDLNGELRCTLIGHQDVVRSVAYDPNGNMIATASVDRTVRVWNLEGDELDNFRGHGNEALCARFHPEGDWLASAGGDNSIRLWKLKSEDEDLSPDGHDGLVLGAVFSPDGQTVASCSNDNLIKLWDLEGNLLRTFKDGHSGTVRNICFQPTGPNRQPDPEPLILSASDDETVKLWRRTEREPLRSFQHGAKVRAISFHPDGEKFVSAGAEATLKLWDIEGALIHSNFKGHQDWILDVKFNPAGDTIATASADGTVKLWTLDGNLVSELQDSHTDDWVYRVAFSPNGEMLASCSGQVIKLWDLSTRQIRTVFTGHGDTVYDVEFLRDGQMLLSASHDSTIKLWSLSGTMLRNFNEFHNNAVRALNIHPEGRTFVSASFDKTVKLWEIDGCPEPIGSMPRQDKVPEIDELLKRACSWLDEYLWTNRNVSISERYICSDILFHDDDAGSQIVP